MSFSIKLVVFVWMLIVEKIKQKPSLGINIAFSFNYCLYCLVFNKQFFIHTTAVRNLIKKFLSNENV